VRLCSAADEPQPLAREDEMDHTALRKEVFAWYGAAAYHAQCVEAELIIARLFLVRRRTPQPSDAETGRIDRDKRTMGGLLKLLTSELELDEGEAALLNTCLEDRNFLAHDYWYRRSGLLFTPQGCHTAVTELQEMSERLQKGNTVAEGISKRIRASLGISEELVHKLQAEFIDGLRSGESEDQILERQKA
jgi:hypothetical protein